MKSKLITGMMLTLLLLSMLVFPFITQPVKAEPSGPPTEWTRTYGGADYDTARSVVEIGDGGYAIAGYTRSFGAGGSDCWLVKTDADGNHVWNRTYGGAGFDDGTSVVELDDGGYAIAGYTSSYGVGNSDFWLVRTDSAGNVMWNRTYGGAGIDVAASMVETGDGGYALAGFTYSFGAGWNDFWLVKTDADGNHVWNRTYGGADYEWSYSVVQTFDGGFALAGYTSSLGVGGDIWLVRTDSAGNMLWNQTYGGAGYDEAFSVVQAFDGGYAVAGRTEPFGAGGSDCWLVKTDADGNHVWNRTYGGAGYDLARSMVQTGDGGYALAGRTNSSGAGNDDSWLVKVDSSGDLEWSKTHGGSELDGAVSVIQTSDGGYALAGRTNSSGAGNDDSWLVKVARAPRIYVDPLMSYAGVGETYTIDVSVADVTNLYGFEFKLGYNTTLLNAIDVVTQPFLNEPTYVLRNEINDESGFVWVAVTSQYPAEPISGNGTLATIFFQVVGSGECILDLYDTKLSDPDGFSIGHSTGDGFYEGGMTQVVSTESNLGSYHPSLAVDLAGNVHVAWHDLTDLDCGFDWDILYKKKGVGQGWTPTKVVSTGCSGTSAYPSLAVDSGGNVHIAWHDNTTDLGGSGIDFDIVYRRYVVGVGWGDIEVVSAESTGASLRPSLAVDLAGNVHVAWHDETDLGGGTDWDIFYKNRTSSWSATEIVSTQDPSNYDSLRPSLAVDSGGNVHIAWQDDTDFGGSGSDTDVFYRRHVVGVGWLVIQVVSVESTLGSYDASLAVDSGRNVHIAWQDDTDLDCGIDKDIFYKNRTANWSPIVVVSTESNADSWMPSLAVDSSGNVHVAWDDRPSGSDWKVFYRRHEVVEANWTRTQMVSTESTENSWVASLAVDSSQNVHIAWHDVADYAGCGSDVDIFYKYLLLHSTEYPWPMFHHNPRHTGYTEAPAPNTNKTQWTYQTSGAVYSSPAVADGKVFVGSRDRNVYALDQQTGALIWNYTTGGFIDSSPAVVGGRVYVGSMDNNTYCLDAASGIYIWDYPTGSSVSSSPTVVGGRVYIASQDGKVYCLDAATGVHIWDYPTGSSVSSSPTVVGGRVYIGSVDGKVYCLDAATGVHIWDYPIGAWAYSSPAVVDDRVYVGAWNGKIYCLAASTGEHIWNQTTGDSVFSSPAVVDDRVYVGSFDDKVYCFNATTKAQIWNYTTYGDVRSSPAIAGGKVYVGSYDGKVYCLDAATRASIWNYTTGSPVFSSPAVADGMVFAGSLNGVVYALGNIIMVPEDYLTIQDAIDAADPGDTISIAAGNYTGSSPVAVINKTLTLLGRTGSSTTFAGDGTAIAVNITDTSYVTITNIDITCWDQGIYIDNSSNCQIYNNGFYLMGDGGVVVDGENAANNVIYNNIFQDSDIAIDVSESSTGNVIYGNTISQNIIGINVLDSGGNTIYCNSFINNWQQVNIFSQPNFWDNGYLGNYWSNYTGTDDDGDGIGDTPHVIDGNNRDNNPLMSPYEYWSNPTLGDVNLDAMVDDEDLFQLAAAYGSTPAKPNWNANCDLNKNYKIEVLDLSYLSKNYGSTP